MHMIRILTAGSAIILTSMASKPLLAFPQQETVEANEILKCARLEKAEERHKCIDALAILLSKKKEGPNANPAPDTGTSKEAHAGKKRSQSAATASNKTEKSEISEGFGAEQLSMPRNTDSKKRQEPRLLSLVNRIKVNTNNIVTYYLENGQTWRQTEGVRAGSMSLPFKVEIKKSAVSGYRLRIEGERHFVRVRRIK